SFGASYRSQINVSGYNIFQSFSDSIPARLQAGFIFRKDGLRGGQDYLIGGVDAAYFFATNGGLVLERKGHVSGGLGFEYNLSQAYGYIPIRLGVRSNQSGGTGFSQRNVVTFGLGFRPKDARFTLDLSGAAGSGQNRPDFALSLGYAFGK